MLAENIPPILMENLTVDLGVLKPHVVAPLEGYTVVVLERVGESGQEFRYLLQPGERPPTPSFRFLDLFGSWQRAPRFLAFAVTDNPELRAFATVDVTQLGAHFIAADILIKFHVSDPRLLVIRRTDDPVRQILKEAESLAVRTLARWNWPEAGHRFREVEGEIVDAILPLLRQYSAHYGLAVFTVSFRIRPGDLELRLFREEAELRKEIELQPLREARKTYERQSALADAATKAAGAAIQNIGESISTVSELAQTIDFLRQEIRLIREQPFLKPASILLPRDPSGGREEDFSDREVAFRAVWPSAIPEETSSSLMVFVSVGSDGAAAVAYDIGQGIRNTASLSGTATTRRVPAGARIRIVPSAPGIHFYPPSVILPELTSWLRTDFEMCVHTRPTNPDVPVSGGIHFFVGPLIVGHLEFSVRVLPSDAVREANLLKAHGEPHRRIFVSYSRRDVAVVLQLERAYKVLGDSCLRDIDILRSGDDWRRSLLPRIWEADVFQLFWSRAARASRNVEEEWQHALRSGRWNFIRPVYWQKPLPPPPTELAHLHFAFYEMPGRIVPRKRRDA